MPDNNQHSRAPMSVFHSSLIGSVTALTEVCVTHPLWTIKTKIQQGTPINYHPKHLYKGFATNALGFMPITATQVGANQWIQQHIFADKPTYIQAILSSFGAGIASSVISCPVERIMTLQGKYVNNCFMDVTSQQFKQQGLTGFFTGQMATALREGSFSVFFISIAPALKKELVPYCINDPVASLVSGVMSGIGATCVSQPVDTIKTIQQSSNKTNIGFFKTANNIYSSQGLAGFFKGTISRSSSIIVAVTLMSWMKEKLEAHFSSQSNGLSP